MKALSKGCVSILFFLTASLSYTGTLETTNQATANRFSARSNESSTTQNTETSTLVASMKATEQESENALKVTYQDFSQDRASFAVPDKNQADLLTILGKSPH